MIDKLMLLTSLTSSYTCFTDLSNSTKQAYASYPMFSLYVSVSYCLTDHIPTKYWLSLFILLASG